MNPPVVYYVNPPGSFRYRLLSETQVAVCLILCPVFVLWFDRFSEEGMTGISMFQVPDCRILHYRSIPAIPAIILLNKRWPPICESSGPGG